MRKRILSMALLLCGVLCANAAVQYMTVEQKSGEKYSFLLSDNPVVTYVDGELVVNGNATTSYAISGVKNYHFTENDQTGVENASADMLRIVSIDENTIGVENAVAGAALTLVQANGAAVATSKADQSGKANFFLPNAKGVYVLSVGNKSFKLIRK